MSEEFSRGNVLELLRQAEEAAARRSLEILSKHGPTFGDDVASGVILLGIDRANARQFLVEADAGKVLELTGVDLATQISTTRLLNHTDVLAFLALLVLTVVVFGWVGLLGIPVLIWLQMLGVKGNVTGNGGFSLLLAIGFALSFLQAASVAQVLWSGAGTVFALAQRLRYAYPNSALRNTALDFPGIRELLVEAKVLVLKTAE